MRLGIIGTGTIASALVTGIAADRHDIRVSDRGADNAARLAALLQELDTTGGLNAQLCDFMQQSGMGDALQDGLNQLETRLKSPT